MNKNIFSLLFSLLIVSAISSQNLLLNGNFEGGGNGVGFNINDSNYNVIPVLSGSSINGDYAFTTDPQLFNSSFNSSGDHTSGTGKMMVVDGTTVSAGVPKFWRAGSTGTGVSGLTIGRTYTFSYWVKSISNAVTDATNQPNIVVAINAAVAPVLVTGTTVVPLPAAGWQKVVYTFVASATTHTIQLSNSNTSATGNDFAIDDVSLLPPLTSATYSAVAPTCLSTNNGSLVIYPNGGVAPLTYNLFSGATLLQTNATGIFLGLASGNYKVVISDSTTPTPGTFTINVANVAAVTNPLVATLDSAICSGSSKGLSVSGGSTYAWSSVPADPSLTGQQTNPNPTVSPTVATTYTVSSDVTITKNLIFNGNFTNNNIGFTSDYTYAVNVPSGGVQGAYGVIANPNLWFTGFTNCGDHTNGVGRMLVADGATVPNLKVWGQKVPVNTNQNYTFSYWIQTLATPNPASIEVMINGVSVGLNSAPITSSCGNWAQYTYTWNSGTNTLASIELFNRNILPAGNDFALDDIMFTTSVSCTFTKSVIITPVAQPTAAISGGTTICPGNTTTLTITGTPGATVLVKNSVNTTFATVVIPVSGTASFITPIVNSTTVFSIFSVNSSPVGCLNTSIVSNTTVIVNVNGCASVITGGLDVNTAVAPICEPGPGVCRTISSSYVDLGSTTSYSVQPIPYCPLPVPAANDPLYDFFPLAQDDTYSAPKTLGFPFCFYGSSFTSVQIGDNGVISFGTNYPPNNGGQNSYVHTNSPLSNLNFPGGGYADSPFRNMILGVYQDTNTGVNVLPAIKSVSYSVIGDYPCRKLVVN
ncbi:MAG: hypothetical protein RLZZ231_898, partial [Bacteroidota bacterium]